MATKKKASKPAKTSRATIEQLTPDTRNANKGTARGQSMLEESLTRFGAGRSILIDKNDRIIAGNKTAEVAADVFGADAPVIVIETEGDELIAVQRTDLDMDADPRARELGIYDNRVGQVNLEWDPIEIAALRDEGTPIDTLWLDHEQDRLLKPALNDEIERAAEATANAGHGAEDDDDEESGEPKKRNAPADDDDDDERLDLAASNIRMVQLIFASAEQFEDFERMRAELNKLYGTDTVTDTVWQTMLTAQEQLAAASAPASPAAE